MQEQTFLFFLLHLTTSLQSSKHPGSNIPILTATNSSLKLLSPTTIDLISQDIEVSTALLLDLS